MIIQPHESWNIYDATKIQDYMDCPRSYFYKYILGWRSEEPNIHLEFGSAWHLAMEALIVNGYSNKSLSNAFDLFVEYYRQSFPEVMDARYHPKNPTMAFLGLSKYVEEYKNEVFEPLYTEIAGSVSLTNDIQIHFKMDSILNTQDGIKSREHKTAGQLSRQWRDQWSLKMQTGVYNHVLHCLFPPEKIWGVEINGAIFSAKDVKFERVPARRSISGMEAWYYNTISWIESIKKDTELLMRAWPEDNIMLPFRMNTENCTKYFGCPFHSFCIAWANPLQRCEEVPVGFTINHWNPLEEEKKAKTIFNLKGKGVDENAT